MNDLTRPVTQIHPTAKPPQAKGYSEAGASRTKRALRGMNLAASGSPVEDIDLNNYTLRQRSRILYMASPIAAAIINTNRTNIIGTGLRLRSTIDHETLRMTPEAARQWERKAETEFNLWASDRRNCDALGMNNFYELQQVAIKAWQMSGDVFVLLQHTAPTPLNPYGLRLHLIEADRISTPGKYGAYSFSGLAYATIPPGEPGAGHCVYDGVEVDDDGRVVAYYVCNRYPYEAMPDKQVEWTRVLATGGRTGLPNILQLMECERPDQYRGVPLLAQAIEPVLQLRRYTEADLQAAIVQSYHTAWITSQADPSLIPFNETGAGDLVGYENRDISEDENEYELGPGTVFHLKEGENITFGNPNIPTAGYDSFVKSNLRLIAAGTDMAYDQLVKQYDASYSASRAAQLDSWKGFQMRREWMINDFCDPVYRVFLAEAVATGRLKAPGFFDDPVLREAWCGSKWSGPSPGSLDPLKEVNAAILQIQNGIKTRSQVTREMGGGEWLDNVSQLAREAEVMKELGLVAPESPTAQPQEETGGESNAQEEDADDRQQRRVRPDEEER